MSLEFCGFGCEDAVVYGCPLHWPVHRADPDKRFIDLLTRIITNQEKIMAAQDDINAAVSAIQGVTTDITGAVTNIQAEIANLNAQIAAGGGTPVDTSALDTAVTALQAAQASVDALETPAPVSTDGTGTDTTSTPAS